MKRIEKDVILKQQRQEIERLKEQSKVELSGIWLLKNKIDELDAEIERLKGICDSRLMHIMNVCHPLITELADALRAKGSSALLKSDIDLLQRAREATKHA